MTNESRLSGAVIVTGAASGIGKACALRVARDGAAVTVAGHNAVGIARTVEQIESAGGRAFGFECDVRHEEEVIEMVERTTEEFGRISGLVPAAGRVLYSHTHEFDLEDWRQVIDTNLTGTFLCVKHSIEPLIAGGGGSIVVMGSTSSVVAGQIEADPAYKASKGGVLQLTKLIAAQYGDRGLRANCLCPGVIATEIVASSGGGAAMAESAEKLAEGVPLGRKGTPEEVAAVASFLLSDDSSYMTGSTIMVDGGFTAL
jgi:3-oxoacyl-[acyl-carrier protein] reductase